MPQIVQPASVSAAFAGAGTPERTAAPATRARLPKWRMRVGYRRALQVLIVVAITASAAVMGYRTLTRPTPVRVVSLSAGSVRAEVTGPGTVQSRFSVPVSARVAGTIDRVLVDVGDEVEKDQLLATIDRRELDARFRATRGAVASAQQDVELARANLAKAGADLDLARIRDERARNLVRAGVVSVADADDARGALLAARANERAARAALDASKAQLGRLSQEQRVAETILSYTALASPMRGVITRRGLEAGSAVAPGSLVFQVVDANALWVATLIDQSLAGRIELGQQAIIRLRSGAAMGGHVVRIAMEADPVTREIEVDVAFDERPSRFAIHEEADVTILGREAKGLTVPLEAVSHDPHDNGAYVYVVEGSSARRRHLRLGVVDAKNAQVIAGLREGDSVILNPSAVDDGKRVVAVGGSG